MTRLELINKIKNFDHYYEYSDDPKVWRNGYHTFKVLLELSKQLTLEEITNVVPKEHIKIWRNSNG